MCNVKWSFKWFRMYFLLKCLLDHRIPQIYSHRYHLCKSQVGLKWDPSVIVCIHIEASHQISPMYSPIEAYMGVRRPTLCLSQTCYTLKTKSLFGSFPTKKRDDTLFTLYNAMYEIDNFHQFAKYNNFVWQNRQFC